MKIMLFALPKFNPDKGRLSIFVDLPIRNVIASARKNKIQGITTLLIRDHLTEDQREESFAEFFLPAEPSAASGVDRNELADAINRALGVISPRRRTVIEYRFGLNGKPELTQPEIGELLKMTKERVRQLEDGAKVSILHYLVDNCTDLLRAHFPRLFAEGD